MNTQQLLKIENNLSSNNVSNTEMMMSTAQAQQTATAMDMTQADLFAAIQNLMEGNGQPSHLAKAIMEGEKLRDIYPRYFANKFYNGDNHYISKLAFMRAKDTGRMNTITRWGHQFSMHPDEMKYLTCNDMAGYERVVNRLLDYYCPKLQKKMVTSVRPPNSNIELKGGELNKIWEGYNLPVDIIWDECTAYKRQSAAVSLCIGSLDYIDIGIHDIASNLGGEDAKRILAEHYAYLSIKPSTIAGKGVFTSKHIKKGEIVGWYAGKLQNKQVNDLQNILNGSLGTYDMKAGKRWCLPGFGTVVVGEPVDDNNYGGCMQMMNDSEAILENASCWAGAGQRVDYQRRNEPKTNVCPAEDAEFIKYIKTMPKGEARSVLSRMFGCMGYKFFIAEKDIEAGAELFYGYGANYWLYRTLYAQRPDVWQVENKERLAEIAVTSPNVMKKYKKMYDEAAAKCGFNKKITKADTKIKVDALLGGEFLVGYKPVSEKPFEIIPWQGCGDKAYFKSMLDEGAPYTLLQANTTFLDYGGEFHIGYTNHFTKRRGKEWIEGRIQYKYLLRCLGHMLFSYE